MVIQNYRDIRSRAAKTLSYTPWDIKKTVLVFGSVPLGVNLLLIGIDYLLNAAVGSSGGLAGMQVYNMLDTASSVLSIAFMIFQIFWAPGILYCGLMVLREQDPFPGGLLRGFRKWKTLLKFYILVYLLIIAISIVISPAVGIIALPFMGDFMDIYAQMPETEAEIIAYLDAIPAAEMTQAILPMLIVTLIAMIAVLLPLFYRARLAQLLILDEEQIGARAALKFSFALTKGSCMQLFRLDLSFWWYYLLLLLCNLIPYGSRLSVFSSWPAAAADLLCVAIYAVAMLGVYMLGLMRVHTANAVAYDHLRTMPQPDLPQLPEETING